MKKFSISILVAAMSFVSVSGSAFASNDGSPTSQDAVQQDETPAYVCEAGVTIPKHLMSYLGDVSTSREAAQASALEKCQKESAFSDYCRPLNCYAKEVESGD